jgi:hypothetical protein
MGWIWRLAGRLIGTTIVAAGLVGCTSPASDASRLQTPQSMTDLLGNVREVTRSGMILDPAFVREGTLKQVFGASTVKLHRVEVGPSVQLQGFITDFPAWAAARGPHMEMIVTWYRGNISDYKPVGEILVRDWGRSGATFETVERVFGKSWAKVEKVVYTPPHPPVGMAPPPTHAMGDEAIVYQLGPASLDREVQASFNGDGTLSSLHAGANGALRGR